jgi:hypothetical protein
MAQFGEYNVTFVFIICSLLWAVGTVSVWYSNTAPHKYVEFTQRIDLRIFPTFDICMF